MTLRRYVLRLECGNIHRPVLHTRCDFCLISKFAKPPNAGSSSALQTSLTCEAAAFRVVHLLSHYHRLKPKASAIHAI